MKPLLALLVALTTTAAGETFVEPPGDLPPSQARFDVDTAVLWRVTDTTPLNYTTVATALTLSSPTPIDLSLDVASFGTLTLHHSVSLLADVHLHGAETVYLGLAAAPVVVFEPRHTRRWDFLFSAGGGFGYTDASGDPRGQSQDFTLNWFARAAVRLHLTGDIALNVGVRFQHLSNAGMDAPNPGLDSLGPSLGLSWRF